ncbi:Transmembrane protein 19 [Seminavis robusta]|uniref:Transmembrane protein 19 n=1 Tax=Seminavis robusta TaxID=568900 RepID=A0A9N8DXG9_9STRA|nr:Transmembrane protein 19 [Seminavis robusta]|eukprot:Sro354_g124880.1 Transmembrane protein 19 (530) ;mRNA; f:66660-68342
MSLKLITSFASILALLAVPVSSSFLENSIIGDFRSVSEMSPQVVLKFIGDCAGKTIDTSSCLVSTVVTNTFGNERWGDRCAPFEQSQAIDLATQAYLSCGGGDTTAHTDLITVLSDNLCFSKLCEADSHLDVESTWMRTCANVHLPYSKPRMDGMFAIMPDEDDVILSCMLHEAMSSPPSDFGFVNPSETSVAKCYPPGYPALDALCANILAPELYSRCSSAVAESNTMFSMITALVANPDDITEDFCSSMNMIAAPNNLECLVPLCNYTAPTSSPSATPSFEPSAQPSQAPSHAPISLPSGSPSTDPSSAPSSRPSVAPSVAPNIAPTSAPVTAPPTHVQAQANVETEIQSEFTLVGINDVDVGDSDLDAFLRVLSTAVQSVGADAVDGTMTVEIVVIGGIQTRKRRRRHLQDGEETLDVQFRATVTSECFTNNCANGSFSTRVAQKFRGALVSSINNGSLAAKINQEAESNNVDALTSVTVERKALSYFTFTGKVLTDDTSAGHTTRKLVSIPMFAVSLLSLFNLDI